jgi:transcriptional regulator GlxA family with amidase domain
VLGDPRLAKAVLAMLERPAGPHSLGELADLAGMGRSAFAGRFSAVLGRAPIEFLKEARLRRAARLLETTDLPVGVVAERVGYASRSYFSRAFKELYGTYPANFRARGSG